MKRLHITGILLITASILSGCHDYDPPKAITGTKKNLNKVEKPQISQKEEENDIKPSQWDQLAKVLAGLPVDSSNPYYAITQTPEWISYSKKINKLWEKHIIQIRSAKEWRDRTPALAGNMPSQILYPFSGADWPFINLFYPNGKEYYLLALEPVGRLPFSQKEKERDTTSNYFKALYQSVEDILGFSFFITKNMQSDLSQAETDGTTPVLLMFLARTGYEIKDVTIGKIQGDGSIDTSTGKTPNIARYTITDKTGKIKTLNYISCDLSNYKIKRDTLLGKYLSKSIKEGCGSYFKAASYLPHSPNFTSIKQFVLQRSSILLQDDSGIPYKDLLSHNFLCLLYGDYTAPINLFKNRTQPNLAEAYQKERIEQISFRIGYGRKTNLIIALKK